MTEYIQSVRQYSSLIIQPINEIGVDFASGKISSGGRYLLQLVNIQCATRLASDRLGGRSGGGMQFTKTSNCDAVLTASNMRQMVHN